MFRSPEAKAASGGEGLGWGRSERCSSRQAQRAQRKGQSWLRKLDNIEIPHIQVNRRCIQLWMNEKIQKGSYEKYLNERKNIKFRKAEDQRQDNRNICMTPNKIIHKYLRLSPSLKPLPLTTIYPHTHAHTVNHCLYKFKLGQL